jgi:hypothetical protein
MLSYTNLSKTQKEAINTRIVSANKKKLLSVQEFLASNADENTRTVTDIKKLKSKDLLDDYSNFTKTYKLQPAEIASEAEFETYLGQFKGLSDTQARKKIADANTRLIPKNKRLKKLGGGGGLVSSISNAAQMFMFSGMI